MPALKRILFPTDYSDCAEHAFAYATQLAEQFGAEVHVLHAHVTGKQEILPLEAIVDLDKGEQVELEHAGSFIIQHYNGPGVETTIAVQLEGACASACEAIVDYCNYADIDLVVMGTHGHRGVRKMLMGSTAQCAVRQAPCSVLTVRPDTPLPRTDVKTLLVPVDFSDDALEAVNAAIELASEMGYAVKLLHVIDEGLYPMVYGLEPMTPLITSNAVERAQTALDEMLAHFPEDVVGTRQVLVGHVAHSIINYAQEINAAKIVIASHGLTGLNRFLLGSVTERVMQQAPCAVWTVRVDREEVVNDDDMEDQLAGLPG